MSARALIHRLVFAAAPFALARHEGCGGTAYQGNPCDVPDPFSTTSNTPPSVEMYWPGDVDLLFLTSRSPTTHLLVFSPDRMPLDRRKLRGTLATGEAFNRSLGSMVLQQRACVLDKGMPYESCIEQPLGGQSWRGRPDRRHVFYRLAGTGGMINREIDTLDRMAQPNATSQQLMTAAGLAPFQRNWGHIVKCNNHRAVTAEVAGRVGEAASDVFYNDAEHAEAVMGLPSGACQWVPQSDYMIQEVAPIPGQYHPDSLDITSMRGWWDHSVEVCARQCEG